VTNLFVLIFKLLVVGAVIDKAFLVHLVSLIMVLCKIERWMGLS
jgi:hypothetical protein